MTKVLVVTYYWPPAGGPGVQRWLNFVRYLPEYRIEPIVFIPENPHYPITDASLLAELPEGIKYYKQPIREPYFLARIFLGKKGEGNEFGDYQRGKAEFLRTYCTLDQGKLFYPRCQKILDPAGG